jgi:hypothetical protein
VAKLVTPLKVFKKKKKKKKKVRDEKGIMKLEEKKSSYSNKQLFGVVDCRRDSSRCDPTWGHPPCL